MKKISLLGIVLALVLIAGCEDAQKNAQLATCQEEKMALQGQVEQANAAMEQKDQTIEKQKAEIRDVNQKALDSIRTMMEKQHAKDIELKNNLKAKEAEALALQQQVKALEEQLKSAQTPAQPAAAAVDAAAPTE